MAILRTGMFYLNPSFPKPPGQRFMVQQLLIRSYYSSVQPDAVNPIPNMASFNAAGNVYLRSKRRIANTKIIVDLSFLICYSQIKAKDFQGVIL